MLCQAQAMQAAALLVTRRLRYPCGVDNGPAQIEMPFTVTKQPVRCIDLALLIACIKLKDTERQKWFYNVAMLAGFSPEFGEHFAGCSVILFDAD